MGKKNCYACRKSCKSNVIKLPNGSFYHEKCFSCFICHQQLPTDRYYYSSGNCYCENDYKKLISENCFNCHQSISGDRVGAHGKFWHQDCFKCALCSKRFNPGEKVTYDGKIYKCNTCLKSGPKVTSTPLKPIFTDDVIPISESPIKGNKPSDHVDNIIKNEYTINFNETNSTVDKSDKEILPPVADHPSIEIEKKTTSEALASRILHFGKHYNRSYLELKNKKVDIKHTKNLKQENPYPQFHRPKDFSYRDLKIDSRPTKQSYFVSSKKKKHEERPLMNNREAISAAKYPDGDPATYVPPIDKDNWTGPSASDIAKNSEIRLRSSSAGSRSTKSGVTDEDTQDGRALSSRSIESSKEVEYLRNMKVDGIGKVFLKTMEKEDRLKKLNGIVDDLDPISSSRAPGADHEPRYVQRYDTHTFASPSRDLEYRPRTQSLGESTGYGRGRYIVSPRQPEKPGYSQKSSTIPVSYNVFSERKNYFNGEYSEYDSETGLKRVAKRSFGNLTNLKSSAYISTRHSLPSMFRADTGPPKIYPYEQLKLSNKVLPPGVDRLYLEEHLSKEEFESIFHLTHEEFYRLAEWKRNDLKKRVELFDVTH